MDIGNLKGKKVLITGKHPHKDETGVIDRAERTAIGFGLVVKLTNGGECFVFKPEMLKII